MNTELRIGWAYNLCDGCPSDLQMDAFWLAGRPSDHPVQSHVAGCALCRERMGEIELAQEIFHGQVFPVSESKLLQKLVKGSIATKLRAAWTLLHANWAAVGILLAGMVVLIGLLGVQPTQHSDNYIGVKGALGLQVFCRRGQEVFQAQPGDALLENDFIRFVVATSKPGYLMILSVNASGTVTPYVPADGGSAVWVAKGQQTLPGSIVLDKGQGLERLFVLHAKNGFDLETVRQAVEQAWSIGHGVEKLVKLPLDFAQTSLIFRRGTR